MQIQKNVSLKPLHTFGIEVNASHYAPIRSLEDLGFLYHNSYFRNFRCLVLGGGSNVLFTENFSGLILHSQLQGITKLSEDDSSVSLQVESGMNWSSFVAYCVQNGYGGVENLALIPSSVGATPVQNIGAYGRELKDVLVSVNAYFLENNTQTTLTLDDCKLGYRDSIFKHELCNQTFICSINVKLSKKPNLEYKYPSLANYFKAKAPQSIQDIYDAVCEIRRKRIPDPKHYGNAGSFFKNPTISDVNLKNLLEHYPNLTTYPAPNDKFKLAAGQLIELAGWKGKRLGDVGTHNEQALILLNYGNATGSEILSYARQIQKDVFAKFNVDLEMEVNVY